MKVLVVSEGSHELGDDRLEGALVILSSRLMNGSATFDREKVSSPRVRRHTQPGKGGRYEKRALGWIRFAEREGYEAIILVIDQDGYGQRERQFDRAHDDFRLSLPRALGVAIKTFDAWMLADEQALSSVLGTNIDLPPAPESNSTSNGYGETCSPVSQRIRTVCQASQKPRFFLTASPSNLSYTCVPHIVARVDVTV